MKLMSYTTDKYLDYLEAKTCPHDHIEDIGDEECSYNVCLVCETHFPYGEVPNTETYVIRNDQPEA